MRVKGAGHAWELSRVALLPQLPKGTTDLSKRDRKGTTTPTQHKNEPRKANEPVQNESSGLSTVSHPAGGSLF